MKFAQITYMILATGLTIACRTKEKPPTCANVGTMLDQRLTADLASLASPEPALAQRSQQHAVAYMTERCEQDHWSEEAISCISSARSDAEFGDCRRLLNLDQRTALVGETSAIHGEVWAHSCLEQKQAKAAASKAP